MEEKQQGPYVFLLHPDRTDPKFAGMTLRDYFAAKAMSMYIQDHLRYKSVNENGWSVDSITDSAYVFADAMLKQREL